MVNLRDWIMIRLDNLRDQVIIIRMVNLRDWVMIRMVNVGYQILLTSGIK